MGIETVHINLPISQSINCRMSNKKKERQNFQKIRRYCDREQTVVRALLNEPPFIIFRSAR